MATTRLPLRDVHTNGNANIPVAGVKLSSAAISRQQQQQVLSSVIDAALVCSPALTVQEIDIATLSATSETSATLSDNLTPDADAADTSSLSGDQLMRLAQHAHAMRDQHPEVGGAAQSTLTLGDVIGEELRHEIVILRGRELVIQWSNLRRLQAEANAAQPTMVVSFLGDTSVGKSTTIGELMQGDAGRPFVQRGRGQIRSTTNNVNLYPCRTLASGLVVNFLDFEGEGGSESFVAAKSNAVSAGQNVFSAHAMRVLGLDGAEERLNPRARSMAIKDLFPRLAYCCSDIVVLIGTDPLYSTRYLERALEFAKHANAGVGDVDIPHLLLISNKRNPDEAELDLQVATERFRSAMGAEDMTTLESYFATVSCMELPNKRVATTDDDSGRVYDGGALYASQLAKLRVFLSELIAGRGRKYDAAAATPEDHSSTTTPRTALSTVAPSTPTPAKDGGGSTNGGGGDIGGRLTATTGLWFMLLPRLVRALNSGAALGVTRLIDDAWLESLAKATGGVRAGSADAYAAYRAFVTMTRPPLALSQTANLFTEDVLQRFSTFRSLACDLAVRITAARLRGAESSLLSPTRIRGFARPFLEYVLDELDGLQPCRGVYGGTGHATLENELGTPLDRPGEPVCCLQEARSHDTRTHRGSRKVVGGGPSLWRRIMNVFPYTPVWNGAFVGAEAGGRADGVLEDLLDDVEELVFRSPAAFLGAHLRELQLTYSTSRLAIEFAPLQASLVSSSSSSPSSSSTGGLSGGGSGVASLVLLSTPLDPSKSPFCVGCAAPVYSPSSPASAMSSTPSSEAGADKFASGGGDGRDKASPAAPDGSLAWVATLLRGVALIMGATSTSSSSASRAGSATSTLHETDAAGSGRRVSAGGRTSASGSGSGGGPLRRIHFEAPTSTSAGHGSPSSTTSTSVGSTPSPVRRQGGMRKSIGDAAASSPSTNDVQSGDAAQAVEQQRLVLGLCALCCAKLGGL